MFEKIKKILNIREPSKWETKWYIENVAIRTTRIYGVASDAKEPVVIFFKEDQYGNRKVEFQMSDAAKKLKGEKLFDKDAAIWIETGIAPTGAMNVLAKRLAN